MTANDSERHGRMAAPPRAVHARHHLVDVVGVKAAHEGVGVHRDGKSLGHEGLDHAVDQRVRPVLLLLEDPCAVGEQWKHRAKAVS